MKKQLATIMLALLLLGAAPLIANNISVSSPTLTGFNTTDNYVDVHFNLSWDNSFRDDVNWDAAWVFVKYQVAGSE